MSETPKTDESVAMASKAIESVIGRKVEVLCLRDDMEKLERELIQDKKRIRFLLSRSSIPVRKTSDGNYGYYGDQLVPILRGFPTKLEALDAGMDYEQEQMRKERES